jgi:hypothetical protein
MLEYGMENGVRVHPHIILMTVQARNGKDGSMLFGELAPIITAMRNRANQPKVDEDKVDEDKVDEEEEELRPRQLEFEKEDRFPAGPQYSTRFLHMSTS